jgi:hypothetical protein
MSILTSFPAVPLAQLLWISHKLEHRRESETDWLRKGRKKGEKKNHRQLLEERITSSLRLIKFLLRATIS